MGRPRKPLRSSGLRGFESHSFRSGPRQPMRPSRSIRSYQVASVVERRVPGSPVETASSVGPMAGVANEAMRQAWDGEEGDNWAALADRFERARQEQRAGLLRAARLVAGENVLD